jgi:hypothetical protein
MKGLRYVGECSTIVRLLFDLVLHYENSTQYIFVPHRSQKYCILLWSTSLSHGCFLGHQNTNQNHRAQAMAVTRVTIAPKEGGPNDTPFIHSQSGNVSNRKFSGSGSDTDIITSSARAYVSALNKLLSWNARRWQQAAVDKEIADSASGANGTIGSNSVAAEPMSVVEAAP